MNSDEAEYIIAQLNVRFPSKVLVTDEVDAWRGKLLPYPFRPAMMAVEQAHEDLNFFPSWHEFKELIGLKIPTVEFVSQLPAAKADESVVRQALAEARQILRGS